MHSRALSILLLLTAGGCPLAARAAGETPAPSVALPALTAEPVEGIDAGEGPGFLRHYTDLAAAGPESFAVWQQRPFPRGDGGGEGEGYRVLGRWLRGGRPEGVPIALTPPGPDSYWDPSAALTRGGQAVVVWVRRRSEGPDLIAGAFGRMGGPWRPFAVDSPALDSPRRPEVAALSDDAFVVVWQGVARSGGLGVDARLFRRGESGFLAGEPFTIGERMEVLSPWAKVAAGPGGFVVVWGGRRDREEPMLWSQRFDPSGTAVGPAQALGRLGQPESAAAVLSLGSLGYAVAWVEATPEGRTVWLRSLSASGEARSPAERVAESRVPVFDGPILAADGAGRLLVAWTSPSAGSGKIEIRGVLWDQGAGLPIAPPFALQTQGTGNTAWPALTGGAGSFLLVWSGGSGLVGRTLIYHPEGSEPLAASAVDCARNSASRAALLLDRTMTGRGAGPILLRPLTSRGGWTAEATGPPEDGRPSGPLRAELPASQAGECAGGSGEDDRARIDWLAGRLALRGEPLPFTLALFRAEGVTSFRVEALYRSAPDAPPSTLGFEVSFDLLAATPGERRGLLRFVGAETPGDPVPNGEPPPSLEVELIDARPIEGRGRSCAGAADSACPSEATFSVSMP